jgi:serine protease AprX
MRATHERGSALWGNTGGRKRLLVLVSVIALVAAFASIPAQAGDDANHGQAGSQGQGAGGQGSGGGQGGETQNALVPNDLYAEALANPLQLFNVILQGSQGSQSEDVSSELTQAQNDNPGVARGEYRQFTSISGVAATISGAQLVALAHSKLVGVITPDGKTTPSGDFSNVQIWPTVSQVSAFWPRAAATPGPTIAFVDSGIDATNPTFAGRVQTQVNFYRGTNPNSPGDGLGHGTFSAGIAAGADDGHAGGAPNAGIVSLDVLDDSGSGSTSDMIAALDWVQQNKAQYNIGVVNISVVGSQNSSFMYDPLDKAVEKLWLNGVVVVASAGNYGVPTGASGVPFAPANDPFVISVGATDTNGTVSTADDFAAPWSAWGATNDGFSKPEIAAPGRYMFGPTPAGGGALLAMLPDRLVSPGYMWMSGTSFSAPVVSAAAAYVLAMHPTWTPDQVKGALMLTAANPNNYTAGGAMGVGEVQAKAAATTADGTANPNLDLNRFVSVDPASGLKQFNAGTWSAAAKADPAWNAMSWSSMSWASASWSSMSWASMSWASMSWASMSWASRSWASMSWASMSWASSSTVK